LIRGLRAACNTLDQHTINGLNAADVALLRLVASRLDPPKPQAERHPSFRRMLERVGAAISCVGCRRGNCSGSSD